MYYMTTTIHDAEAVRSRRTLAGDHKAFAPESPRYVSVAVVHRLPREVAYQRSPMDRRASAARILLLDTATTGHQVHDGSPGAEGNLVRFRKQGCRRTRGEVAYVARSAVRRSSCPCPSWRTCQS